MFACPATDSVEHVDLNEAGTKAQVYYKEGRGEIIDLENEILFGKGDEVEDCDLYEWTDSFQKG